MLVRADGSVERLGIGGPVLGVLAEADYEQAQVALAPGDRIVLFTDGLTEARDVNDDEFGEDRLLAAAVAHRACSAPALQARLADAVAAVHRRPIAGRCDPDGPGGGPGLNDHKSVTNRSPRGTVERRLDGVFPSIRILLGCGKCGLLPGAGCLASRRCWPVLVSCRPTG